MAKTKLVSWSTSAVLALGAFVTSAMAQDTPEPSADAPQSDQRRLRILFSAGPVFLLESGAQVGAAFSIRTGTHTAAFVAIDAATSDEVTTLLGFRFATRPYASVTPYFSFAYARLGKDGLGYSRDPYAEGLMAEWGIEFPLQGRARAFIGGRAGVIGDDEAGAPTLAVTFGVNLGLH